MTLETPVAPGPGKKVGITACAAVLAVVCGIGLLKTDYLDPKSVVDGGTPGVFTLDRCERGGGSKQGPSTFCYGDFRSDDGKLTLAATRLTESHDAEGTKDGESFEAHASKPSPGRSAEILRSDDQGRSDLTMRGLGAAGLALLGVMLGGFAARARMAPGPARSRLGAGLGFGALTSSMLWLLGTGTGSGFWA